MAKLVCLFIAIAVDTSEMRFLEEKHFHLHKSTKQRTSVCLSACLSVLLMNKTSTNRLIFYFDKAKKKCVFRLHEKYCTKIFCFC